MGNRFVTALRNSKPYSERRYLQMINEADFEAHRMRPYGYDTGKFQYRSMWKIHQSRNGNRVVKRLVKKAARAQAKRELQKENEN